MGAGRQCGRHRNRVRCLDRSPARDVAGTWQSISWGRDRRLIRRPIFGVSDEIAFDDPRLNDFAATLAKDTSALILVAEEITLADFTSAVEPFGGRVIQTNLNEDEVNSLKKALKKGVVPASSAN